MMKNVLPAALIVFCVNVFSCQIIEAQSGEARPATVLAIVPDAGTSSTGIPALLTAELSQRSDLQLSERADFQSILKQHQISVSMARNDRLQLSSILKSDMMLLLSVTVKSTHRVLNMSICESQLGARLSESHFIMPAEGDNDEKKTIEVVQSCIQELEATRIRFENGVQTLVAVPPFVSKSLDTKHDGLQAALASLLEASLVTMPGVAVLALDEAASMRRELEISQAELRTGHGNPVVVDGEFRVNNENSIWLQLKLRDGDRVIREITLEEASLDEALSTLSQDACRRLLNIESSVAWKPLTREELLTVLNRRADYLTATNGFRLALPVREAAILFDPTSFRQRVSAIHDYVSMRRAGRPSDKFRSTYSAPQQLDTVTESEAATIHTELVHLRRAMKHLEFLIRNRLVNPGEAARLLEAVTQHSLYLKSLTVRKPAINGRTVWEECFWPLVETYSRLDPELRFGQLASQIRDIPPAPKRSLLLGPDKGDLDSWTAQAQFDRFINVARYHLNSGLPDVDPKESSGELWALSRFERLLTDIPHPNVPSVSIVRTITQHLPARRKRGHFTEQQIRDFYERLKPTSPVNRHYAEWGLLELDWAACKSNAATDEWKERVGQLRIELRKLLGDEPAPRYDLHVAPYSEVIVAIQRKIRPAGNPNSAKRSGRLPPANYLKFREGHTNSGAGPVKGAQHVQFVPLDVDSPWFDIIKCNDDLDVLWEFGSVAVQSAAGPNRTIFSVDLSTSDYIQHVAWDGQNVWIATALSGVVVVSPEGLRVSRFTPDNQDKSNANDGNSSKAAMLPRYVHSYKQTFHAANKYFRERSRQGTFSKHPRTLWLHAVEPGRCIVVGVYGQDGRSWIVDLALEATGAKRSLVEKSPAVQPFHMARKSDRGPAASDPEEVFAVKWSQTLNHNGKRIVLLGRSNRSGSTSIQRAPLAIDLESLDVSVFPWPTTKPGTQPNPIFLNDSQILYQTFRGAQRYDLENGEWKASPELRFPTTRPSVRSALLKLNQRIYFSGFSWAEVDFEHSAIRLLNENSLPRHWQFEHYADSAHMGPVAWNRGDRFFRIVFGEESEPAPAQSYAFVPAENREKHKAAAARLQSLGASLVTQWSQGLLTADTSKLYDWRTTITFSPGWEGDDSDLALLDDLYHLDHVVVDGARPTDAGMRFIGNLPRLQTLSLVDTSVTDQGLARLNASRYLTSLKLVPQPGNSQLTDVGLLSLKPLSRLERLTIQGSGFTAGAIPILQANRSLTSVTCIDTRISQPDIDRARKVSRTPFWIIQSSRTY